MDPRGLGALRRWQGVQSEWLPEGEQASDHSLLLSPQTPKTPISSDGLLPLQFWGALCLQVPRRADSPL